MAAILGYGTVGSNKLTEARAFYDELLGSAGLTPLFEHPSGGRIYGLNGSLVFGVLGPYDGKPATVGNGSMFAFRLETPDEVRAFHAKAVALGGKDEGAPGERGPKMFFSYFRDREGNKLCAYAMG
jgi:catechol 2,3-dioxygenase-like lactoylglutathione lyase family enzyme